MHSEVVDKDRRVLSKADHVSSFYKYSVSFGTKNTCLKYRRFFILTDMNSTKDVFEITIAILRFFIGVDTSRIR